MSLASAKFKKKSEQIAFDLNHRKVIKFNINKYKEAFTEGKKIFTDIELAKERAANIRTKVLNNLDHYLIEFESNFERNGGKVLWASDAKDAVKHVLEIIQEHKVEKIVKSKSMVSEEIQLNSVLKSKKIECLETDLGEYIVQLSGEKPYHIVTPAMHKTKEDIASLLNKKFGSDLNGDPKKITSFVRGILREKFENADMGITGANFLLPDIGGIAITENEGNAFLSYSLPKVHVIITGIEKLLTSYKDLSLFWPLLSSHGTGQALTTYNSVITGPKKKEEKDGSEFTYIILLDNGRTDLLGTHPQSKALSCIHCGACLNVCPVFHNIGGHTYDTPYGGPIGAVISPFLSGFKETIHLSFASSLCGSCTDICPVKIPLHQLLLHNRNLSVKKGIPRSKEKTIMKLSSYFLSKRSNMDSISGGLKTFLLKKMLKSSWGSKRVFPVFSKRSFAQQWKKRGAEDTK
ncbi:MAG: lactate utilization protein B [Hyphomicrobiales bacterium]